MFTVIPLAADVEGYALAVHGGPGPTLFGVSTLAEIERPLLHFAPPVVSLEDMLWSDPSDLDPEFAPSERRLGSPSGSAPRGGYSLIVRGHKCVPTGLATSLGFRVITVFSASR